MLSLFNDLKRIYGFSPEILLCSEFMSSSRYQGIFSSLKKEIKERNLEDFVRELVPQNKRAVESAIYYPLHEFACVQYLVEQGFLLKIGPAKEQDYDQIMKKLGIGISFAYLLNAYALGTRSADKVIHYVPSSRGPNNGQRIFFGDDERKASIKLQQGGDEALHYFCKIASVSGQLLGKDYLLQEEINSLSGKKLKQKAIRLVVDNIIKPYQELHHGR